ncbi:MAG: hypothetical protein ACOCNC_06960 [Acetivibrio ethanolgignens]
MKKVFITGGNKGIGLEFITHISKEMVKVKSGRIVNVASVAGQIGHPDI